MRHLLLAAAISAIGCAERINHAGRILGPEPVVTASILFNTTSADAVVAAMQIMPRDNPWNEVVSTRPLHADSAAIMARIRNDLVAVNSNRNTLRVFSEMNFALLPPAQPLVGIAFLEYPDDSNLNGGTSPNGSYPIPGNWPIEGWPSSRDGETLAHAQTVDDGGDRHAIAVVPGQSRIYEVWRCVLTTGTPAWTASNGAIFQLDSNATRPAGLTSGDAAGLPMFPALIRYDECERGAIEHALRIVVNKSRRAYIWPATHYASNLTDSSYPAMGQRVRLQATFAIPAGWSKPSKAVAQALKTYGAMVADNGGFFSVSACPDDRFPAGCFDQVQAIDINQFEVVASSGPTEGPRSAGAPTATAGADLTVARAAGADLVGSATGSGLSVLWSLYDPLTAPGTATFGTPGSLASHVAFGAPGRYTLMLRVADGAHTPAYDAVVVTVTADEVPLPPSGGGTSRVSGGEGGGCGSGTIAGLLALAAVGGLGYRSRLRPLTD